MSRIGKKPIVIPDNVQVDIAKGKVSVKGPKGTLELMPHPLIWVDKIDHVLNVKVHNPSLKKNSALWGLWRSLINNMMLGVTQGYSKKLEINGIGYKAAMQANTLVLNVGFTHSINYEIPAGILITVTKNIIEISGIDKERVGHVAAEIRAIRKAEPYKGKGIKYIDEVIRRKAGKAAAKTE